MTSSVSGACVLLMLIVLAGCDEVKEYPVVGTLERDRIALTAERAEPVIAIHVGEGQPVEAGTLLVEQDPDASKPNWRDWRPLPIALVDVWMSSCVAPGRKSSTRPVPD